MKRESGKGYDGANCMLSAHANEKWLISPLSPSPPCSSPLRLFPFPPLSSIFSFPLPQSLAFSCWHLDTAGNHVHAGAAFQLRSLASKSKVTVGEKVTILTEIADAFGNPVRVDIEVCFCRPYGSYLPVVDVCSPSTFAI